MTNSDAGIHSQPQPGNLPASGAESPPETELSIGVVLSRIFQLKSWLWALVPVICVIIQVQLSPLWQHESIFGGLTVRTDPFQLWNMKLVMSQILPFGLRVTASQTMYTSLFGGLLALVLGFFMVAWLSRSARMALFAFGPYYAYYWLNLGVIWLLTEILRVSDTSTLESSVNSLVMMFVQIQFWPFVLKAFLGALATAAGSMAIAHALARAGKLKLEDCGPDDPITLADLFTYPISPISGLSARRQTEPVVAVAAPGAVPASLVREVAADSRIDQQGRKRVTRAIVCPFCGDPRLQGKVPVSAECKLCRRKISILLEREDGDRCQTCHGILVWGARFCHHCGALYKGIE